MKATRARRGMTLMELMVALAVTGLMASAGVAAFNSIIDSRRVIRGATVETERAAALRETLRSWLISGTPQIQQGGGPRGNAAQTATTATMTLNHTASGATTVTAAAAAGDELIFTTTAPNPAMSASARMRLFVDGDAGTPETGLTLEYQSSAQTPLQRRQLDPAVGTLVVEFLDTRTNRWYAASEAATIQPRAFRITLQPIEGGTLPALEQIPMTFVIGDVQQTTRPGQ